MDRAGVERVLRTYFDASFECSGEKMDQVFRPEAHVYGMREGEPGVSDLPRDRFVELVGSMTKTEQTGWERLDEIHSIEFVSEVTAIARISLLVRATHYSDVLNLVCDQGEWRIIAKLSYGRPYQPE